MRYFKYILIIVLFQSNPIFANEMIPYQIKSELFMNRIIDGNVYDAYSIITDGRETSREIENLRVLTNTTEYIRNQYGNPIGFEFVDELKPEKDRVIVKYLLKNENFPIIWEFYYHKQGERWILDKINFYNTLSSSESIESE